MKNVVLGRFYAHSESLDHIKVYSRINRTYILPALLACTYLSARTSMSISALVSTAHILSLPSRAMFLEP